MPGTVVVTVRDLSGAAGGSLAGVLFSGQEEAYRRAVGGFGILVEADPFTTTQTVGEPSDSDDWEGLFPYVTRRPLRVEPGTYTLMLSAAAEPLTGYSHWHPANALRGCAVTFTAKAEGTEVTVYGIQPWIGVVRNTICATEPPTATAFGPAEYDFSLGVMVPAGFHFVEATEAGLTDHARLMAAVPDAFAAQSTWQVNVGSLNATVSRLSLAPDYTLPADPAVLDEVLLATASAVPDSRFADFGWMSNEERVVMVSRFQGSGAIDTYAWADPWQRELWVLSEVSEHQFGQFDWPALIDAFIAAQLWR
jgi:hypothetical protein